MTESTPYVPTSEELESGNLRRPRRAAIRAEGSEAQAVDDVVGFELRVEQTVDKRSRRRS